MYLILNTLIISANHCKCLLIKRNVLNTAFSGDLDLKVLFGCIFLWEQILNFIFVFFLNFSYRKVAKIVQSIFIHVSLRFSTRQHILFFCISFLNHLKVADTMPLELFILQCLFLTNIGSLI